VAGRDSHLQVDQRVELDIDGVGALGEGVGRINARAVFVPRALPGERVSARIVHLGSNKAVAEPVAVLRSSPDRVDPVCAAFGRCGGCQIMHAAYPAQLLMKRAILEDALRSIAGLRVPAIPIAPAPAPLGYRNRGQYPVSRRGGRVVTGFYAPRSHDVVAVSECHIHDPRVDRAVACVRAWAGRKQVPVYDERRHRGFLRHVVVRVADGTGEVLVVLVGREDRRLPSGDLVRGLRHQLSGIAGVVLNVNPARTNVILGRKSRALWGRAFVHERFMSLELKLSVGSFFQVNTAQARVLFGKVLDFLGAPAGPVVDAYCGVGVLATLLARQGHQTVGIDSAAEAVEDARAVAADNRAQTAVFHRGRAEQILPRLVKSGLGPRAVILDPPRKGCAPEVVEAVAKSGAEKVACISCHPGTLSRDLKRFFDLGYRLHTLEGVDMFPQTSHLEVLAGLIKT
jgi:23S rRNA (uracil1939-C5)-methyltransferase